MLPDRFGRYVVAGSLGEGGFGHVLLARDTVLGRDVTLKVPREAYWAAEEVLAEARALARLRHPAILQVLDVGIEGGRAFLVLEHVPGRDLAGVLAQRRAPFPPAEALDLLAGPAAALDHAHAHGVLHLDVKPANLLVPREAGEPVKVLDFGLAAVAARHAPAPSAVGLGDPRYAAPEAWRGRPDRDSDVFSLAAVFFELVAGRPPLPGQRPADHLAAAGEGVRLRLSSVRPELPAALDAALQGALSPRRHERPAGAEALIATLREALRRTRERRRLVDDARERIRARESAPPRRCEDCGAPLNPRARSCPHCRA